MSDETATKLVAAGIRDGVSVVAGVRPEQILICEKGEAGSVAGTVEVVIRVSALRTGPLVPANVQDVIPLKEVKDLLEQMESEFKMQKRGLVLKRLGELFL